MIASNTCATASQSRLPRPFPCGSRCRAQRPVLSALPPRSGRDDPVTSSTSRQSTSKSSPCAESGAGATTAAAGSPPSASGTAVAPLHGVALLASLAARARNPSTLNVYGNPYPKTELAALDAAVSYILGDARGSAAADGGAADLRCHLLEELLLDAAVSKRTPLPVVEGSMALLELLTAAAGAESSGGGSGGAEEAVGPTAGDSPALFPRYRWQLVVGADVGGVQYIPAVEELEVAPDGSSFTLGTDLDFIFTGFSGPCKWLAPGHLSYDVRKVRVEIRWPKAWRRAAAWLAWRWRLSGGGAAATVAGDEPEWSDSLPTSPTCREEPAAPAVDIPLTFFPNNELLTFSCNGRVAATRSRLTGGLILLLEVDTREDARHRSRQQSA